MKITSYTATGTKSTQTISDVVFGAEVNQVLLSQAVRIYRANLRQGTSKVKTRSEINRTKKKWFKQKGTGNARHGARTPNIFVGGGVSHGPDGLREWRLQFPQQLKHAALISALSAQVEKTIVHAGVDELNGKTKAAQTFLKELDLVNKKVLIIGEAIKATALRSLQNIDVVLATSASRVTALDVVSADAIILTPAGVEGLVSRLAGKKADKKTAKPVAKPVAKVVKAEPVKTPVKAVKTAKVAAKPVAKAAAKPKTTKVVATKTKAKKA